MDSFGKTLHRDVAAALSIYGKGNLMSRAILVRNLLFTYHTMRASESLLRIGRMMAETDSPLAAYYNRHLAEEAGHAVWMATDLKEGAPEIDLSLIPREAMQVAGVAYFMILHVNAAALLGYMLVLEGFPLPLTVLGQLESRHGKTLLRTVRYHAENDTDHRDDLLDFLDSPALDHSAQLAIRECAISTAHALGCALIPRTAHGTV